MVQRQTNYLVLTQAIIIRHKQSGLCRYIAEALQKLLPFHSSSGIIHDLLEKKQICEIKTTDFITDCMFIYCW